MSRFFLSSSLETSLPQAVRHGADQYLNRTVRTLRCGALKRPRYKFLPLSLSVILSFTNVSAVHSLSRRPWFGMSSNLQLLSSKGHMPWLSFGAA